jgi:hypothetical protein
LVYELNSTSGFPPIYIQQAKKYMIDFNALLAQYANSAPPVPAPTVVDAKKESITAAATAKKTALGGEKIAYDATVAARTGYGMQSLQGEQRDLATMDSAQLFAKYGSSRGAELIGLAANASAQVSRDSTGVANIGDNIVDAGIDIASGAVNAVGGIGALGIGLVNEAGGTEASRLLSEATKWGQSQQSDSLNARRRVAEATNELAGKDNEQLYKQSDKGIVDSLAKTGRDVIDAIAIGGSDAQTLLSGVSQGVGSMLTAGPIAKVISKGAAAVGAGRLAAGAAPTALAIGAQSAGGGFTATVNDAMESLKDRTDLTEEQKISMANNAGLMAAAIAGPAGVAAGSLVAKFEANPFAKVGVRTALQNTGKETLEEGLQSGASGVAQNLAIQQEVDPSRELNKDLGRQIGEGALYGAGTAGAVSIPALARGAVTNTAAVAAKGLDAILTRADRLMAQTDAASPVSDQRVNQAVNELGAGAPEAVATMTAAAETEADPVVKAAINKFAEQLSTFNTYDPASLDPASPDSVKTALTGVTDKPTAIQALAKVIVEAKTDSLDRLVAASAMLDMLTSFENLQNTNNDALDALPDDHPAQKILAQYGKAAQSLGQSPAISKAVQEVIAISQKGNGPVVTDENIATPEGMKAVQATAAIAQVAPQNSNVDSLNVILKQAADGKIQLTPRQLSGMKAAAALMNAAKAADAKAAANGLTELSRVSAEIQTETGAKGLSALDHGSRIRAAYDAGDYATGKAQLEDFMLFAQHMQNKLGAINAAFASGIAGTDGAQKYQSLGQKRNFTLSSKALGVTPASAGSIRFAQSVALEADRLGGIVNGLADAFPELGVQKMGLASLAPELDGVADTVANEFASGVRSMPGQAAQNVAPAVAPVVTPKATPVVAEPVVAVPVKPEPVVKAVAEPEPEIAPVPDNGAAAGLATMKFSELSSVLENLENNPDKSAKNEETIAEIKEILAERLETDRAKREAAQPKVAKAEPVAEPIVSDTGNVFEGLVSSSRFGTAFQYTKNAVSRLVGLEKPLRDVYDALASTEALKAFTGVDQSSTLASDVAGAYQNYLRLGNKIKLSMKDSLAEFIQDKKVVQVYADPDKSKPTTWINGKPMNITREVDGTYQYDETLLDGAVLAGLQWRITAMDRSSIVDERDAAAILSLTEEQVGPYLPLLKNTMGHVEAIRAIAAMLPKYWGVQSKSTESDSYAEGIPLGVAAEVFAAMVAGGMLKETVIDIPVNLTGKPKTVDRYELVEYASDKLIQTYPTAIEQAVSIEPTEVRFMGSARPPVATAQMRNSFVENSPAALKAVEAEGNTPFYLNLPLFEMYKAMGLDAVMEMFGEQADVAVTNVNHLKTLEGRNLNLASSFKSIEGLVGDLENQAEKAGVPAQDFAVRYAYNMSKVNRLQQLGRFGPQASKFVRELLLPTRSTIDVSKVGSKEHKAFGLALAQALGVKVHTISVEASNELIFKKLENEYSGAVESLAAWLNDYDPTTESRALTQDEMASIKERLGKDFTPVAVHALMEYARYKAMDVEAKKAFTTSLYVEADGVTNGPINAMMLMTTGKFTTEWVNNIRKGGLFLGLGNMTMNEFRGMKEQGGNVDLYETAANGFKKALATMRQSLKQQPVIESKMNSIVSLMNTFLPDLIKDDGEGGLDIDRKLVKNPLTVTIYGAGAKGVSSKITQALLDAVYARMTDAAKKMAGTKMSWGEAMFGAGGEKKFDNFVNDMNSLTQEVVKEFKGEMYVKKTPTADNRSASNPKDFTLQADEISNLSENLLKLFVTPLRQGITDTLGSDLTAGVDTIQQATQVQSIFMANAYMGILEKIKATKPKGEFLSKADLKTAMGQLKALHPLVQTEEQSYFIAGRDAADDNKSNLAASLGDRFKMPASVYGPRDAGVKGIPFLVIGMGDGVMMQRLATMMGAPEGTLKVFDGMNMKLSTITEDSEKSNEAVTESWKGNPFKAVSQSFDGMLLNGDLTITDAMLTDFKRIFADKELTAADALAKVKSMGASLKNAAVNADVRKQVLADYSISVDQMASAAAPFKTSGKKQLTSTNLDEIVAELNEAYDAKLAAMKSFGSDDISTELSTAGKKAKNGTRTLVLSTLKTLQKEFSIPDNMAVVLEQVLSSLAPKGYKVIYGTPDQLAAFATSPEDAADVRSGVTSGWTSTIDKTVYLAKPSAETLVHELVHASTIETLVDHYNGKIQGNEAAVVSLAVSNMEKLMAQFLNSEERLTAVGSPELIAAYRNARQAILGFSGNDTMAPTVAKAAALNEFMAWALANQNLATVLKTEKANPLARLAEQTIALIKKLLFGRKAVPAAGQDVFSNLLFNSSVIMAVQGKNLSTAGTAVPNEQIILKQSSPNDNARLVRIQDAFDNMVVTYLNTAPSTVAADQVIAASIARATDLALDAQANGFGMTLQESTTLQSVVAALATQAKIDPASMARAQTLYTQVTKELTIQDFMADPTSQDPNEYDAARKKYEWLMGQSMVKTDALGRSSLLSAFLGMAIVNDELRAVLSKMAPTKIGLNKNDSADNVLENLGMNAMENLSATLSNTKGAPSVQAAINALTENIIDLAERNENLVATTINNATGRVNQLNAKIVEGMNALSDYALSKTERLAKNNPNSKSAQAVNAAVKLTSLLVSEEKADAVSRGVMSGVNRTNLVRPIRELFSDLIGRTSTNAVIVDMIKKVRSVVQQDRQAYRENVPTVIAGKFTRPLLDSEWSAMFRGMGKTDLASLITGRTRAATVGLITDTAARTAEIKRLEKVLTDASTLNGQKQIAKSKQLAEYMMTGKAGMNLLRNSFAIGKLWGEGGMATSVDLSNEIDQLVSLYALEKISPADMVELSALVLTEAEGVDFALAYLTGQREEENRKASLNPMAQANAYKGHIPSEQKAGVSLIVADDSQASELRLRGYIRTGDYVGSNLESGFASKGYYFSPVGGKGAFTQGLLQNVNQTAGGVDLTTGLTVNGMTAGNTVDPMYLAKLLRRRAREQDSVAPLLPVFDDTGSVVAFERSIDPAQADKLEKDTHLAKMIGVWRGRQVEEVKGQEMNYLLIDNLKAMYDEDMKTGGNNRSEYVNLFGNKLDPVTADALKLMSKEVRDYVEQVFGNEFMVRKDIINDAVGYRAASVRDLWSGVTHWDPKTAKVVQRLAISTMGVDAYKYLVNAEKVLQNYIKDAKVLIVMKSVIVPAGNLVSNMVQLLSRGVSPVTLYRDMPRKTAEIDSYVKNRIRHVEAEAELLAAANDPLKAGKLRVEIKSIEDSYRRLSIWPLINAGEFSAISDAGISREEILLSEGKLHAYMENAVSKLPESLQTAGKYALVTKDTALFQAVQKATEYGDFLGKAILFDHLMKTKGKTEAEALAQISEEYVNYDRLPGRFRGSLESNGLLWFYNFKIRSVKVAASMIRNNPLQVLLAGMIPTVPVFGNIGTPVEDNFLTILAEGRIGNSMGIGQGLTAPALNPWWNLIN